jgi:hypothetical protein
MSEISRIEQPISPPSTPIGGPPTGPIEKPSGLGDIPSTPVSTLSDMISYMQNIESAMESAWSQWGPVPQDVVSYGSSSAQDLLNGLLSQYGSQMSAATEQSLKTAITNLGNAQSFEDISNSLPSISISPNINIYSPGQTASELTSNILQNVKDPSAADALVSMILSNVPQANQDGLSSGSPSVLASLFPMTYPDSNQMQIFPQLNQNTTTLAQNLLQQWTSAGSPSNVDTWLAQGSTGYALVQNFLGSTLQNLGNAPSQDQINNLTDMVNDLGNFLDTLNKSTGYNLPNYGPAIGQFGQDLKYTNISALETDYQNLLSSFNG